LPTLLAAPTMFLLALFWHHFITNDLRHLQNDFQLYLALLALGYVMMALVLTILIRSMMEPGWGRYKELSYTAGLGGGASVGVSIGFIAYALSISSAGAIDLPHVLVDLAWQVFEQGTGGLMVVVGIFLDRTMTNLEREGAT
jgi:hypothetical protein